LTFYAAEVTVYSLLFVVLMVQLVAGSNPTDLLVGAALWFMPPPGETDALPSRRWPSVLLATVVLGSYLTAGLVIPLAILAGFLGNATLWRALAFTAATIQIIIAGGSCFMAGVAATQTIEPIFEDAVSSRSAEGLTKAQAGGNQGHEPGQVDSPPTPAPPDADAPGVGDNGRG
jgi:hypothetical protein